MSWVRFDESFAEHPKIVALSDAAFRAHVQAICYSSRLLTDGVILKAALPLVGANTKTADALVAAGLWEPGDGGYIIHDYLEYNPTREEVLAGRASRSAARAAAGRIGGLRSGERRRSKSEANSEAKTKHVASDLFEAKRSPVPSRPLDDSLRSSSPGDDDELPFDDGLPSNVREMRDTLLSKLGRYANEPATFEEAELFARDYAGMWAEFNHALAEVRRTPGQLPFPGNLRRHMPSLKRESPKPRELSPVFNVPAAEDPNVVAMAQRRREKRGAP